MEARKDFFISRAGEDREWANRIADKNGGTGNKRINYE
jgi:hypothetical protein